MLVRYVTWGEYGGGVYASQVLGLVELLGARCDAELLALVSPRVLRSAQPPLRGQLLRGPLAGRFPLVTLGLRSRALERAAPATGGVLHCRGPLATHAALRVGGWHVLHDYRGVEAAQIEEAHGRSRWTRRLARLEREACLRADLVSVVSEPMRELVVSEYGVPGERVSVVPTGARVSAFAWREAEREAARAELGVGDGPVVAYVGSAADWQLPEVIVATAKLLAAAGVTVLVLSQDAAAFAGAGALVRTAAPADVARLLCAADAGLLPRRRNPVNAVAAPVKFAEYLAAGVPVVAVRGTGSFADRIASDGLGALAEGPDAELLAATALSLVSASREMRSRCRELAEREYDLERIADRYVELYRALTTAA